MWFKCACGERISDNTDCMPWKAHLIPDQSFYPTLELVSADAIDALGEGRIDRETAHQRAYTLLTRAARSMWQCRSCGRLYVNDHSGQLRCFAPEGKHSDNEVLRGPTDTERRD